MVPSCGEPCGLWRITICLEAEDSRASREAAMNLKHDPAALPVAVDLTVFDITPEHPVSLLGYFNNRISSGILDRLFCRMLALRAHDETLLLIQLDNCLLPTADAEHLRTKISDATAFEPGKILVCTNHTHTAPALTDFYGTSAEREYAARLFGDLCDRAAALNPERPCSLRLSHGTAPGLSHNRRWLMKNGSLVTNPPKGSGDREAPEGAVDEGVEVIGFYNGRDEPVALMASISNHTDTVGGTRISADWTGYMERAVQERLNRSIPVVPLIAPQGNINHYDFDSTTPQTGPGEAVRIGRAYADVLFSCMGGSEPVHIDRLDGTIRYREIAPREVCNAELRRSLETVHEAASSREETDLKAEDLETPAVRRLFAEELITFHQSRPPSYRVPLQVLRLGDLFICAVPGEPFAEIGLDLKRAAPAESAAPLREATVIPVALANGYFGYIPPEECFERGGYEVQPGRNNCLSRKAAGIITAELKAMMESL
jgi:hypothetical protein